MLLSIKLLFLSCIWLNINTRGLATKDDKTPKNNLPITIRGSGIDDLHKHDVAMILYITVSSNEGSDGVHYFINSTNCCQKFGKDKDCESMRPLGGDMGKLFPGDYRNLTMIYPNLYPHDRVGQCDVEIRNEEGVKMTEIVPFNTRLIRDNNAHIPRLLQKYYKREELVDCKEVDENPLDNCIPYECDKRYDGTRNYFNNRTRRCEAVPTCMPDKDKKPVAFVIEKNDCVTLRNAMTPEEFVQFKEGKPGAHKLALAHSYPINVQCHNGVPDSAKGKWCKCHLGWDSAPFDHKSFNPNVQVYHMCTVWTGELSAEEARNITSMAKSHHRTTSAVLFSLIAVAFVLLVGLLVFILYSSRIATVTSISSDQMERQSLTKRSAVYD